MLRWSSWGSVALMGLLGAVVGSSTGYRRKVSLEYNPGFNTSAENLLHVRAVGPNDTIHYIWSTIGAPTVLLIYTGTPNSTLRVDWKALLSPEPIGALQIEPSGSVIYSKAIVFNKVYEFNGVNTSDLSRIPDGGFYPTYDLADLTWKVTFNQTARKATFRGISPDSRESFWNGSISFQVTAYENSSRDGHLPRLLHTANSSKVVFVIQGVPPRGNHSRFVLEILTLEEHGRQQVLQSVRSIDDEYTPSIFEMAQLVPKPLNGSVGSSFLQWKTVAYSSQKARREDTVHCQYYPLQTVNVTLPKWSIAHAYFTEPDSAYGVSAINITFGSDNNEAYEDRRYLSWTALIGFGEPPRDTFSPLVIAILAVGVGTPVVLLTGGMIVALVLRRRQRSEYEPIN